MSAIEIWGGVECTLNRVQDAYFDQLVFSGHADRLSDLDLFAELGIQRVRYPALWERLAPVDTDDIHWDWMDERLSRMQRLGIHPILGLVHHGSGPRYTDLLDPGFPEKLARYASRIAERYPWVEAYTPVNEPLTTARFSGLYGIWYPHQRSPLAFVRALIYQVHGIQLAMEAIREFNPRAQLIQTEDIGRVYSHPSIQYQADHENLRRWLSLDLLCGWVDEHHPLYQYLLNVGITTKELQVLCDHRVLPDTIGLNYYVTSERYLDTDLEIYPEEVHGGNGQDRYADVEYVRVAAEGIGGWDRSITETWERYHLPLALTEVHLGGTREEQLRWLMEGWNTADARKRHGVDIRAFTAWSLLGAYNWPLLAMRDAGLYEPGVFDLRAPSPRSTLLARALKSLAIFGSFDHPVLDSPGWWRRSDRIHFPAVISKQAPRRPEALLPTRHRLLLITGATGTLGKAFQRICQERGLQFMAYGHSELDIADEQAIRTTIEEFHPWAVINTAGYVNLDGAEQQPEQCRRANTLGVKNLARTCARMDTPLLTFSSDLVFDGEKDDLYLESDIPLPLSIYGSSKAVAEHLALTEHTRSLVIRTSAYFGNWDKYNFAYTTLDHLVNGEPIEVAEDLIISPTYIPDLAHAAMDLLLDGETGIWHLANQGALSWAEFARLIAVIAGFDPSLIQGKRADELGMMARRPHYSALGSEKASLLPILEDAVTRYVEAMQMQIHPARVGVSWSSPAAPSLP